MVLQRLRYAPLASCLAGALCAASAFAVDTVQTVTGAPVKTQTSIAETPRANSALQSAAVGVSDTETAQFWGLSVDEVRRAKALLRGPRASFSIANLSPIEALGIHARSEAERQRYAELFARAVHADTERVLAWAVAYQQAMARLYPNEAVIDYSGLKGSAALPSGVADAADVPRAMLRPAASAPFGGKR